MEIMTVILAFIIGLLIIEKRLIQRSVRCLPLRILINGTRGKSSVTEYVAAGLSSSQNGVMAKITGITPTVIHNGVAQIINRQGITRVQEQLGTIFLARRKKVRSLVLECMSVAPELQKLESSIFQPHIYVITNIRDDHHEEMGTDLEHQAEAICSAIPKNCRVVTNEKDFLYKIKEKAAANNSIVITTEELENELKNRLPFGVFPENVALAFAVCNEAGVERNDSELGIMKQLSDRNSPLSTIRYGDKSINFLNAFAVNDVSSTESFINLWKKDIDHNDNITLILNTRSDRPLRTDLFSEWIAKNSQSFKRIILTGSHTGRAKYFLIKSGLEKEKIESWNRRVLRNLKMNLMSTLDDRSLVIGIGNIGGDGFYILNGLK